MWSASPLSLASRCSGSTDRLVSSALVGDRRRNLSWADSRPALVTPTLSILTSPSGQPRPQLRRRSDDAPVRPGAAKLEPANPRHSQQSNDENERRDTTRYSGKLRAHHLSNHA